MTWIVKFADTELSNLKVRLLASDPFEAGAVLLCNQAPGQLLVDQILFPIFKEIVSQTETHLSFSASFVARALKAARDDRKSVIFLHTHPFSDWPTFSSVDDAGERVLLPTLFSRVPGKAHGFLVIGREGFDGRVYTEERAQKPVSRLVEVGAEIRSIVSSSSGRAKDRDLSIYDRAIRAFGIEGQRTLSELDVGIVGLGGTGSIVAEQLAHLGVGALRLLDNDVVESTNLNRLVGATPKDIGTPKVRVAADMVSSITGSRTEVEAIVGDALEGADLQRLLKCDFIFCCTDNHGSRAALIQLSYQYLIPMIDMGVQIDTTAGYLGAMSGRVQMMAPGLACLQCRQLLDPESVRRDFMNEHDRAVDPYITGFHEPQPAVISLNGTVSSLAVTMFLSAVVGVTSRARSLIYRIADGIVKPTTLSPVIDCVVCSRSGALAKGDSWPLLTR